MYRHLQNIASECNKEACFLQLPRKEGVALKGGQLLSLSPLLPEKARQPGDRRDNYSPVWWLKSPWSQRKLGVKETERKRQGQARQSVWQESDLGEAGQGTPSYFCSTFGSLCILPYSWPRRDFLPKYTH